MCFFKELAFKKPALSPAQLSALVLLLASHEAALMTLSFAVVSSTLLSSDLLIPL